MIRFFLTVATTVFAIQTVTGQTNSLPSSGSVGIGTTNPLAKLDVRGAILVKNLSNSDSETVPMISQSLIFGDYTTFGTSINTFTESAGNNSYSLQFLTQNTYATGLTEKMRITSNGNVGIGNPKEKLSVNGNIRAHEIKVEMSNWPDYVFENSYQLMPLREVENYIKLHGHLPEMPNASQIETEGVSIGEMNKLLVKKIEELTLYVIELERKLNEK